MSSQPDRKRLDDNRAMEFVEDYLLLVGDRRIDEATRMLSSDAVIVFPGGVVHRDLHSLVSAARNQYRWVAKTLEHGSVGRDRDGNRVVTHRGELNGIDLDGAPFSRIRYIDVFVLNEALIAEQHVFNDLAIVLKSTSATV